MAELDERQLEQESFVATLAVMQVAFVGQVDGLIEPGVGAAVGHRAVLLADAGADLEEHQGALVATDEQVTEVGGQAGDDVLAVEAFLQNLVEDEQRGADVAREHGVGEAEIVVVIEHVEVLDHGLVGHVAAGVADGLIEDGEGVAHAAVGFLGDDVEGLGLGLDALLLGHVLQVADDVGDGDAGEVVDLTAGEDRGEDLVLLRGGEDEDGVVWRVLRKALKAAWLSMCTSSMI